MQTKNEQCFALLLEVQCIPEDECVRVQDAINRGLPLIDARTGVALIRVQYDNHLGEA